MTFADRLDAAIAESGNPCLLGIDPHLELLPEEYAVARDEGARRSDRAAAVRDFCLELVEVATRAVPAVKPQSAFFEQLGADGVAAWESVVAEARRAGLLVIGDVKRGDISSTAAAYARAFLDPAPPAAACDAITVNPYLGSDSIEPLLATCERVDAGLFVLVRTSNPGGAELQLHGEPPLWHEVARSVDRWGEQLTGLCGLTSVGAVVGATHPAELPDIRARLPRTPLLLPGLGAQGASVRDLAPAFLPGGRGALLSASRSIAFAYRDAHRAGQHWKDAARSALTELVAETADIGRVAP